MCKPHCARTHRYGVNDRTNPPHLRNLADPGSDFLSFKQVARGYARLAASLPLPPGGEPLHVQFANELNLAWDCTCTQRWPCVSAARIATESAACVIASGTPERNSCGCPLTLP